MSPSDEPAAILDPFQLCGTTIEGKYRVASVVGDGGFGVVYRGVHKGFGELIAVKCLKIADLDVDRRDALLEQLRDEGRLLHRLSKVTSGIVQALDVGAMTAPSGAWVPYLVLEWLEGETLAEHLSGRLARGEGPYALADAIRLLEPAARALAVAHQQKIAHRDVKPPNLFVTDVGGSRTLKVLDFGIAKVITESTAQLEATKQGPSAFTPRYGAPEQFNKQRGASGPWTDVFALALILVEAVTGKKALDGDDPTQLYIASADASSRPTLRARGGTSSDAVEQVLAKALAIDPRDRYAGAGEFWDALVDAAGLAPPTRASAPSLVATREAARPSNPAAATDPGRRSDSPSTPRESEGTGLGVTIPAESLAAAKPPVVVENKKRVFLVGPDGITETPRSAPVGASANPKDPMAETPIHARLPPAPPTSRPSELTLLPKAAAKPRRSSVAPYVGVVVAAGAAVLYFFVRSGGADETAPPRGFTTRFGSAHPSGRARSQAPHTPRATAGSAAASGASSTAGSASAPLPTAPPDDMIALPPGKFALGEGADARHVVLTRPFFLDKFEVSTRAYLECVAARKCGSADRVSVTPDAVPAAPAAPVAAPAATSARPPPDLATAAPPAGSAAPTGAPSAASAAPAAAAPSPDEFAAVWTRRCNAPRKALDHPINCVDFRGADAFCRWKGKRLPTEAEWEAAARGHESRTFAWGDAAPECGRACYDRNGDCMSRNDVVSTCAEGVHPADKTIDGLYDMGGNVAEWTADGFMTPAPGGTDPIGAPAAPLRSVRGGSFLDGADRLRAASRVGMAPGTAHVSVGFRCAMDAAPPPE